MEKKISLTHKITEEIAIKIKKIINGNYQQAALGTIDDVGLPMVTKIIPMNYDDKIYLLISDLSEHTKNLNINPNASLYFAQEETHKIKSNNPRLTLQGFFKKVELKKDNPKFQILLKSYNKVEPGSKMWGMFTDFNFYVFIANKQIFVEGFGKAYQGNI
ncbi:MAG: pyridoxamine 5'-phosphate oxidase family protein [Paracoccaceae bacterium]